MALRINVMKDKMHEIGIGNKELSLKSGVPLRTVNNILGEITTNPTIDNLIAITRALGIAVDDVIEDNEPHTIAAHHDAEEWTPEELAEVEEFKKYVRSKRKSR